MTTLDQSLTNHNIQLNNLIGVNIQDFLTAFGLKDLRAGRKLVDALCWYPARRFAEDMIRYDQMVAEQGLQNPSQEFLERYTRDVEVIGLENIPGSGPVLILSNHPGMTDTLVLFSSIPRDDLRIIAAERPFLRALPNVSDYLINVAEEPGQRIGVVRAAASHLRTGAAILTFPAGEIEPDPAWMSGAIEALGRWSESVAIFTRLVPDVAVVVALVSGVAWPAAFRSPLTRLRRERKDREHLGAALQALVQLLVPFYKPVRTRVEFSHAFKPVMLAGSTESSAVMQVITSQVRSLIEQFS